MAILKSAVSPTANRPDLSGEAGSRAPSPEAASVGIDLLPIPAAMVRFVDGRFSIENTNQAFATAGLGASAARSQLLALIGGRISAFVGDALREEFSWQF